MLGGSSSMNAMIYIRGHQHDYDHWASLGNEEWGYENILPYFTKSEHNERLIDEFHGQDGLLNIAEQRDTNYLTRAFVQAAQSLGYEANHDFNGSQQEGFGVYQVTQKNGRRHSTAVAFLKPALKRPNLTVITHAQVGRLCIEGTQITGVEYLHENRTHTAQATQEVILSGGAINSPQLLMLSGIGPAQHLKELGIPVVVDLPGVGQNLQDHPACAVVYEVKSGGTLEDAESWGNYFNYLMRGHGPFTSNVGEGGGFIKTDPSYDMPDVQFIFAPVYFVNHGLDGKYEGHAMTVGSILLHPESRGQIKLKSAFPFMPPIIQPNYFASEKDMRSMVAGLKVAKQIGDSEPFSAYRGQQIFPQQGTPTEEEWQEHVRNLSETLYHPVGTCKMGKDPMSVVNSQLQVYGVQNLRVVDGSVMPTIVGGNTHAPIVMIAEKAADMILQ